MPDRIRRGHAWTKPEKTHLAGRKTNGGQALIIVVVALPMLFGMVGLAVDVGYLEFMERSAQTAADAGAMAGAADLAYGTATAGARAATAVNGFTNGVNGVAVAVHNPPSIGRYSTNPNAVEVIVSQTVPTFFLNMVGVGPSSVRARSVAATAGGGCVYAMNPTATSAFSVNVALFRTTCGIYVDSNASSAVNISIGAVNTTPAKSGIVGGVGGFFGSFTPPPITGIAPFNDPLAYLPAPSPGSCTAQTLTVLPTTTEPINPNSGNGLLPGHCWDVIVNSSSGSSVTLNAGRYHSISVDPATGATAHFNAGLYTITGSGANGGFNIGPSFLGNITGSGVTFYLASTAGGVTISGFNLLNLVAPSTGLLTGGNGAGILFFQDPGDTNAASINGLNIGVLQGALYFPKAALNFRGCCTYAPYTIMVADTINILFDIYYTTNVIGSDYSSLPGGSPIKRTLLVE